MVPGPSSVTAPLIRAAAVRSTVAQNARMAHKYQAQAAAGQTRLASHAADASHGEEYPPEGFHGAFWRNSALAVVLAFVTYRLSLQYAPATKPANIDESHPPNAVPNEATDKSMPFLTRYLAYHMPRQGLWKELSDKHLELTIKQAEDKLLIQDAQRPRMRKIYQSVELASPHSLPVGGTFVYDEPSSEDKSEDSDDSE